MLDPISSKASPTMARHLSVCRNNSPLETERCNVLLVEPAMIPRSDRERVLSAANYCVTAVRDVRELFELRFEKPVAFAVLNDLLGAFGLRAAAESVRRQWPLARILVIGCAVPTLEDHLYDETISHRHEEDGFLDVFQILMKESRSQKTFGGSAGYRRAMASPNESDPTKIVAQASSKSSLDVDLAPQRMRATG